MKVIEMTVDKNEYNKMKDPKEINQPNGPDDVWTFELPTYRITNAGIEDGEPVIIKLARGNKDDESAPRQEGVFTESLLEMCVQYLTAVNKPPLNNRDTSIAITHIEDALLRIQKRADDRRRRAVQGSYKP